MQYWVWNRELKIFLYGVNRYSQELADTLRDSDFQVSAYIDRRAKELKNINGVDVYEMKSVFSDISNKICVIIMLQNAMQHDEIAKELFDKGVEKIIFVPMLLNYNKVYANDLRRIYNRILLGDLEEIEVPYYRMLVQDSELKLDETFYIESKNYITLSVSADILYTTIKEVNPYADIPLVAFKPYDQMFRYFLAEGAGDVKEYLEKYGVNSCNYTHSFTDDDIILQREMLYEIWNEHFQEGIDFFVSSAPLARWNSKGYFNLMEGQHRTLFLIKKGIYYLPVQISREDYERWKNISIADEIKGDEKVINAKCPIHNPYFQKNSFYNKISVIDSMLQIQQNLPEVLYRDKEILNIDLIYGYYGFNFCRMGGRSVTLFAVDDNDRHIMKSFVELYRLKGINIQTGLPIHRLQQFHFISIIGYNEKFDYLKWYIINDFDNLKLEAVLLSLTHKEMTSMNESMKKRVVLVSKVYMEKVMSGIYLLR